MVEWLECRCQMDEEEEKETFMPFCDNYVYNERGLVKCFV